MGLAVSTTINCWQKTKNVIVQPSW